MKDIIVSSIQDSINLKQKVLKSEELLETIHQVAQITTESLKKGGKVLLCGNGGSAADAQHLAGEFVSRFRFDRPGLPAVALNCNASIMTSIGNDYEYNYVFERQVEALGRPGDVLWAFTASGNSENIRRALKKAHDMEMTAVGFLGGDGGICKEAADFAIVIPVKDIPRVQESHITVGHALCDCIEQTIFAEFKPNK